jgi:hypothetical protein
MVEAAKRAHPTSMFELSERGINIRTEEDDEARTNALTPDTDEDPDDDPELLEAPMTRTEALEIHRAKLDGPTDEDAHREWLIHLGASRDHGPLTFEALHYASMNPSG